MWWRTVYQLEWTASLLPSNATPWELVAEAADSDLVARDPVALIPAVRRANTAPMEVLPYLAAERSVDEFSGDWTEARQRAVIAGSFAYHQVKGTRPAIDRALQPLDYAPQVVEWFEASVARQPNTFSLRIVLNNERVWLTADRVELIRVANGAKNAHTKLDLLDLVRDGPPAFTYLGGVNRRRRVLRVGQVATVTNLRTSPIAFTGAASRRTRRLIINPRTI